MDREKNPLEQLPAAIKVELLPDDPQWAGQALHPEDSHAYSDSKDAWIKQVQAQALLDHRRIN